ncbi:MAG: hypothetical protein KKE86_01925 [Planctomycetes bacterium]|nr:hypothetical protein [Planctomycetota bacterium]MBU4398073.1 hypothetical protein [Planctomycetota bacterium]MCG2684386.1 hypothetical protein [Planctomycetales bacterium]
METISAQRSLDRIGRGVGVSPAGINRAGAVVVLTLLAAAAATIAWRRLAGALVNPLEPAALLTAGALTAGAAAAVRAGWPPRTLSRSALVAMLVTSLSAVVLLAALCLPGTPPAWVAGVGLLLAAEESWAWVGYFRCRRGRTRPEFSGRRHVGPEWADKADVPSAAKRSIAAFNAMPAEEVTQQLIRSRAADGTETLSGWLRTFFAAGQRTGSIHVAFCPPLDALPKVAVEQIDGPEARIRTAQALPYGVRLDLKLAVAAREPTGVLLQFSATSAREKQPVCR